MALQDDQGTQEQQVMYTNYYRQRRSRQPYMQQQAPVVDVGAAQVVSAQAAQPITLAQQQAAQDSVGEPSDNPLGVYKELFGGEALPGLKQRNSVTEDLFNRR